MKLLQEFCQSSDHNRLHQLELENARECALNMMVEVVEGRKEVYSISRKDTKGVNIPQ